MSYRAMKPLQSPSYGDHLYGADRTESETFPATVTQVRIHEWVRQTVQYWLEGNSSVFTTILTGSAEHLFVAQAAAPNDGSVDA
jgi:hypothetical protein